MKNDVKKVNEITTEMRINDLIYKIIDDELDDMIFDCDELDKEFEKLYFAKRVLSVPTSTILLPARKIKKQCFFAIPNC